MIIRFSRMALVMLVVVLGSCLWGVPSHDDMAPPEPIDLTCTRELGCSCQTGDARGVGCAETLACRDGRCVVPRTCQELHSAHPELMSGTYKIKPFSDSLETYCEMDVEGGGWTMVYKIYARESNQWIDVLKLWKGQVSPQISKAAPLVGSDYWNELLSRTPTNLVDEFNFSKAMYIIYDKQKMPVAWAGFNFTKEQSANNEWFEKSNYDKSISSYKDVDTNNSYFTIDKCDDDIVNDCMRRWYAYERFTKCEEDEALVVVINNKNSVDGCWADKNGAKIYASTANPVPTLSGVKILYADRTKAKGARLLKNALVGDVFAVFFR